MMMDTLRLAENPFPRSKRGNWDPDLERVRLPASCRDDAPRNAFLDVLDRYRDGAVKQVHAKNTPTHLVYPHHRHTVRRTDATGPVSTNQNTRSNITEL